MGYSILYSNSAVTALLPAAVISNRNNEVQPTGTFWLLSVVAIVGAVLWVLIASNHTDSGPDWHPPYGRLLELPCFYS